MMLLNSKRLKLLGNGMVPPQAVLSLMCALQVLSVGAVIVTIVVDGVISGAKARSRA